MNKEYVMLERMQDTIAAISTAVSESGIGIIRISGPQAIDAASLLFRSPAERRIFARYQVIRSIMDSSAIRMAR